MKREGLLINLSSLLNVPLLHFSIETNKGVLLIHFLLRSIIVVEDRGFFLLLAWEMRVPKEVDVLSATLLH